MVVRKLHKGRPAGEEWKNDWDKNGHLRIQHTPCGKPPAMDAYGIKWLILVEGRVILTGYELSRNFPWMLESQRPSARQGRSMFEVGYMAIPPDWEQGDYQLVDHLTFNNGTGGSTRGLAVD